MSNTRFISILHCKNPAWLPCHIGANRYVACISHTNIRSIAKYMYPNFCMKKKLEFTKHSSDSVWQGCWKLLLFPTPQFHRGTEVNHNDYLWEVMIDHWNNQSEYSFVVALKIFIISFRERLILQHLEIIITSPNGLLSKIRYDCSNSMPLPVWSDFYCR